MNTLDEAFYRVSIKAIIQNPDHNILYLKEKDGRWELPGGGLKHRENIEQALRREILEELGVELLSISDTPRYIWTQKREKDGIEYYCLFLGFLIELPPNHFSLATDEAISAEYLSLERIRSLPLHPNLINFLPLIKE